MPTLADAHDFCHVKSHIHGGHAAGPHMQSVSRKVQPLASQPCRCACKISAFFTCSQHSDPIDHPYIELGAAVRCKKVSRLRHLRTMRQSRLAVQLAGPSSCGLFQHTGYGHGTRQSIRLDLTQSRGVHIACPHPTNPVDGPHSRSRRLFVGTDSSLVTAAYMYT